MLADCSVRGRGPAGQGYDGVSGSLLDGGRKPQGDQNQGEHSSQAARCTPDADSVRHAGLPCTSNATFDMAATSRPAHASPPNP